MWASVVAFFKSYKITAELAQMFVEAWISAQVREIQNDYSKKEMARRQVIKDIEQARKYRDTEKLIALNHTLAIIERGRMD